MTKIQKGFCVFLCLCFFAVLAVLPEPFSRWENVYRHLPLYRFLEKKAQKAAWEGDEETARLIVENNGSNLGGQLLETQPPEAPTTTGTPQEEEAPEAQATTGTSQEEEAPEVPTTTGTPQEEGNPEAQAVPGTSQEEGEQAIEEEATDAASMLVQPHPVIDLSPEKLADFNYVLNNFFVVDENTATNAEQINAAGFLEKDMTLEQDASLPQILIYHSHSQEAFADSREGEVEDTVVGVGNYLAQILTEAYGYNVIHVKETFDIIDGEMDRSRAYDYAREYLEPVLEENPSIEVIIDLHRDGIPEDRRLVTEINGKPTAQIMFYNGLSYTVSQGAVEYLPNPYIEDNLAFSFQLEYQAARYYPELYRCIYLAGLRYNLHLRPRALLLEAGAQTNTVQEVKNAMEPFADILNRVLKGSDK